MYTQHGAQRKQERGISDAFIKVAKIAQQRMSAGKNTAVFFKEYDVYVVLGSDTSVITTYKIEPYGEVQFNAERKARNKAKRNGDFFIVV